MRYKTTLKKLAMFLFSPTEEQIEKHEWLKGEIIKAYEDNNFELASYLGGKLCMPR